MYDCSIVWCTMVQSGMLAYVGVCWRMLENLDVFISHQFLYSKIHFGIELSPSWYHPSFIMQFDSGSFFGSASFFLPLPLFCSACCLCLLPLPLASASCLLPLPLPLPLASASRLCGKLSSVAESSMFRRDFLKRV